MTAAIVFRFRNAGYRPGWRRPRASGCRRGPYEVILVDDGSTDDTGSIAQQSALAGGSFVFCAMPAIWARAPPFTTEYLRPGASMSFLSTPISPIPAVLEKLKEHLRQGADLVLASRYLPGSGITVKQPAYRRLLGGIFRLLVRTCLLPGINDSPWGCKGFRLAAAKLAARQLSKGFAFDVELLYLARKLGFVHAPLAWPILPAVSAADGWRELGAIPGTTALAMIALVLLLTQGCLAFSAWPLLHCNGTLSFRALGSGSSSARAISAAAGS